MNMPIPSFLAHPAWIARQIEDSMSQELAGTQLLEHFPRDVAALASDGLEIPILRQPHLTVHHAREFLCILRGVPSASSTDSLDRPLYGLLHIGPPSNFILISEELSTPFANYVIAHEIGHFFADVFFVQQRWSQSLPEKTQQIRRFFAWQQRDGWLELQALVRGLPSRPTQIMARGRKELPETARRERQADLIARELLAPWYLVAPLFVQHGMKCMVELLCEDFGLPAWVAHGYQDNLETILSPYHDVVDRLFGPLLYNQNLNHE